MNSMRKIFDFYKICFFFNERIFRKYKLDSLSLTYNSLQIWQVEIARIYSPYDKENLILSAVQNLGPKNLIPYLYSLFRNKLISSPYNHV